MSPCVVFITVLCCTIHPSCREISTFARSLVYWYRVDLMVVSDSGGILQNRPIIYYIIIYGATFEKMYIKKLMLYSTQIKLGMGQKLILSQQTLKQS